MRAVVATYGTRGDVEPIVALAAQLRAAGADVRVCAPPDDEFVDLLARADAPVIPFGKPWHSWAQGPSTAEERVLDADEFVAGHIAATYEILAEATVDSDVMLATGMLHFVARSVAEKTKTPSRFALFSPGLEDVPDRDRLIGPPINAHRASIGLAPVEDVRTHLFGEQPWMAADPILAPEEDFADRGAMRTPAWLLPDARPLPGSLMAFLDAGPPPVFLGFGSMRVPRDIARQSVEAVRAHGRRVIVGHGFAEVAALDRQDDCFVLGEVNQQALFPRVSAVVHHGGAGTTTAAARAGAPQVIVPQAADQPHWGNRVAQLGIGAAHPGPNPTRKSLSTALESVLTPETRARASGVAGSIRTDGAAMAARSLLDVARSRPGQPSTTPQANRSPASPVDTVSSSGPSSA